MNGLGWTDIDTGATVYTEILVHLRFPVIDADGGSRTLINTRFASGTFVFVNYGSHDRSFQPLFCVIV